MHWSKDRTIFAAGSNEICVFVAIFKAGLKASLNNFCIQNVVAVVHCPWGLDLVKIHEHVNGFCSYEPELFPGLVCRVKSGKGVVVFLCFCSGKCVITGGKTRESIMQEWAKFYSTVLSNYKSTTNQGSAGAHRNQQNKTLDNNESWGFQEVMHTSKTSKAS